VIQLTGRFVPIKLNAEKDGETVARKYEVRGFPTILFIDPELFDTETGGVVGRIRGYLPPVPFSEQLQSIAQAQQDFPALLERLKVNKNDLEAISGLVVIHHMRQENAKASDLLETGLKIDPENAQGFLTKALNAVADTYQEASEFDKAIVLFKKAAQSGKKTSEIAYAKESIAACYMSQGKIPEAATELNAVLLLPGLSEQDQRQARSLQAAVQDVLKRDKNQTEKTQPSDDM